MKNDVVLTVNGINYSGWESIDVTVSMETLSGVFNLSVSDNVSVTGSAKPIIKSPPIIPGDACVLSLNGNTLITGYVDKVQPQITSTTHTIIIQGRDKSGDLCDCSMVQPINQWKNLILEQLITRICQPFGIPVNVVNADTGAALTSFVVEQGATCFEAIQKLALMRQCLVISDGKGGLTITRSGTYTATTSLIEGVNILAANGDYDYTQRFSQYLCKGQKQGDDGSSNGDNTLPGESAYDSLITRTRPLLIIYDGQAVREDCQNRANWELAVRRGKSIKLTVTVAGWTQADGTLWGINQVVYVKSVYLGQDGNLLISAVNFKLDENGELTILTLTSPDAYSMAKPTNVQKSNQYITASGN